MDNAMKSDENIIKKYVTYLLVGMILCIVPATVVFVSFDKAILDNLSEKKSTQTIEDLKKRTKVEKEITLKNINVLSDVLSSIAGVCIVHQDKTNITNSLKQFMHFDNIKAIRVYDSSSQSNFVSIYRDTTGIKVSKKIAISTASLENIKKDAYLNSNRVGVVELFYDLSNIDKKMKIVERDRVSADKSFAEYIDSQFMQSVIIKTVGLVLGLIFLAVALMFIYKKIKASMNGVVDNIDHIGQQIYNTSSNVSNLSSKLQHTSKEQSIKIDNISRSIIDTTAQIESNSNDAIEADRLSSESNSSAKDGFDSVKKLSSAMDGIRESSAKISNIIQTIDEIAFQTNLLALNAAVEAARAGEHGLGFAVVAEEVRALAGKSAEAAKQITDIINSSVSQVNYGTKISSEVVDSFEDILSKVETTTQLISNISYSTKEQLATMTSISSSIEEIDKVTNSLNDDFDVATSSSEELFDNVKELSSTISLLRG
jgi:methyl-accepting chemotaxis protein/methyl-accepting chemotaxis protein-2 (aspartate sensor receptor)